MEYFIAAAAMAAATLWLVDGGDFQGVRGQLEGEFGAQMGQIGGPVSIP